MHLAPGKRSRVMCADYGWLDVVLLLQKAYDDDDDNLE